MRINVFALVFGLVLLAGVGFANEEKAPQAKKSVDGPRPQKIDKEGAPVKNQKFDRTKKSDFRPQDRPEFKNRKNEKSAQFSTRGPKGKQEFRGQCDFRGPKDGQNFHAHHNFRAPEGKQEFRGQCDFRGPKDGQNFHGHHNFRAPEGKQEFRGQCDFRGPKDGQNFHGHHNFRAPEGKQEFRGQCDFRGPKDGQNFHGHHNFRAPEGKQEFRGHVQGPMPFGMKDGKIEIKKVVKMLEKMDSDHDGFVSQEERMEFRAKMAEKFKKANENKGEFRQKSMKDAPKDFPRGDFKHGQKSMKDAPKDFPRKELKNSKPKKDLEK